MKKRAAFFAAVGAVLAFLGGWLLSGRKPRKACYTAAVKTPEEVKREIENTPASELISASADADRLHAAAAAVADRSKQRLRDRANAILSGHAGAGTDAGGGSGD